MDDALRVRSPQTLCELQTEADYFFRGHRAGGQLLVQRVPGDVFRDQKVGVIGGIEIVDGRDVRVVELGEDNASWRNRLRAALSARVPGGRTFIATSRSNCSSCARKTTPIPPAPICCTMR